MIRVDRATVWPLSDSQSAAFPPFVFCFPAGSGRLLIAVAFFLARVLALSLSVLVCKRRTSRKSDNLFPTTTTKEKKPKKKNGEAENPKNN